MDFWPSAWHPPLELAKKLKDFLIEKLNMCVIHDFLCNNIYIFLPSSSSSSSSFRVSTITFAINNIYIYIYIYIFNYY